MNMILQKKKEINYIFHETPVDRIFVDYGNGEMLSWLSSMREIEKKENTLLEAYNCESISVQK